MTFDTTVFLSIVTSIPCREGVGEVLWGKFNPLSISLYWETKWDMSCIVGLWLITELCANDQVDQDVSPLDVSAHFFVRLWLIKLWACGTKSVGLRPSALASGELVTSNQRISTKHWMALTLSHSSQNITWKWFLSFNDLLLNSLF